MGAMQSDDTPALKGVRILVVEDDPLLLLDLESVLLDAGADIAGLCASVAERCNRSSRARWMQRSSISGWVGKRPLP
jgi:hypothetical protein